MKSYWNDEYHDNLLAFPPYLIIEKEQGNGGNMGFGAEVVDFEVA